MLLKILFIFNYIFGVSENIGLICNVILKKYQKIYPGIIPEASARVTNAQVIGMILSAHKDKPAIEVLEILNDIKSYINDYKKLKENIGDKDGISIDKLLMESRRN